jgi:hypothetical protein
MKCQSSQYIGRTYETRDQKKVLLPLRVVAPGWPPRAASSCAAALWIDSKCAERLIPGGNLNQTTQMSGPELPRWFLAEGKDLSNLEIAY